MRLCIMMVIRIRQHLSKIWSSIYESEMKNRDAYKKSCRSLLYYGKLRIIYPKNHGNFLRAASLGSNFTSSHKKVCILGTTFLSRFSCVWHLGFTGQHGKDWGVCVGGGEAVLTLCYHYHYLLRQTISLEIF